jgi:hypothetical protein
MGHSKLGYFTIHISHESILQIRISHNIHTLFPNFLRIRMSYPFFLIFKLKISYAESITQFVEKNTLLSLSLLAYYKGQL